MRLVLLKLSQSHHPCTHVEAEGIRAVVQVDVEPHVVGYTLPLHGVGSDFENARHGAQGAVSAAANNQTRRVASDNEGQDPAGSIIDAELSLVRSTVRVTPSFISCSEEAHGWDSPIYNETPRRLQVARGVCCIVNRRWWATPEHSNLLRAGGDVNDEWKHGEVMYLQTVAPDNGRFEATGHNGVCLARQRTPIYVVVTYCPGSLDKRRQSRLLSPFRNHHFPC